MTFRRGARIDASQVEDLRGRRVGARGIAVGGGGAAGIVIILLVALLGVGGGGGDLGTLLGETVGLGSGSGAAQPESTVLAQECRTGADANEREDCQIVGYVTSIQAWWTKGFADAGQTYEPTRTRFFSGLVDTACGTASSEVGPFYCPADRFVYIDLGFFEDLKAKYGATGGPFARAYIIAHEYAHHVQSILGLLRTGAGRGATSQAVRTELQADCLAGVWAYHAVGTGLLEPLTRAQVNDALNAAASVGDDRIQQQYQGRVTPESWTHGSSEQRQRWFMIGLESGDLNACDTSDEL
jgi:predicted metalloprotease